MNIDKRLHRGSVDRGVLKTEREYGKEEEGRPGRGTCVEEETLTSSSSAGECNGSSHQMWWPGSSSIELRRAASRDHMMQRRLVRAGMVEVRNTD